MANQQDALRVAREALLNIKAQLDETFGRSTHNAYELIEKAIATIDSVSHLPVQKGVGQKNAIHSLISLHASQLNANPHCYFELAYTRTTEWMVFICDKPAARIIGTPNFGAGRKILFQGQGSTADEACRKALASMTAAGAQDK